MCDYIYIYIKKNTCIYIYIYLYIYILYLLCIYIGVRDDGLIFSKCGGNHSRITVSGAEEKTRVPGKLNDDRHVPAVCLCVTCGYTV